MAEGANQENHLKSIVYQDRDAVRAYTLAIERMSIGEVKQQLNSFRSGHERQITNLSNCLIQGSTHSP
jgi:hypothetical protein